jgi:hypothetical protein
MSGERLQGTVTGIETITLKKDGTKCKRPYKRITVDQGTFNYFEGARVVLGDVITYKLNDDSGGQFPPKLEGVNVLPAGTPAPVSVPAIPPAAPNVDYNALRLALVERLGTDEAFALRVDQVRADFKGLLTEGAALVALAGQLKVPVPTTVTRSIDTPASGKSGSEHATITTTTYPTPPASPLCQSPWSNQKNDLRYSEVKIRSIDSTHELMGIKAGEDVEEIWYLWSHPRLLFIKRGGAWTTVPAKGHAGVVWLPAEAK